MRAVILSALLAGLIASAQSSSKEDPWPGTALMQPAELAAIIDAHKVQPSILYVGFPNLYKGAHIRGAVLDGPASKASGLEQLRQVTDKMPRDHAIVIYCGCCPFDVCPNVRPAYRFLKDQGFTNVRVVKMPTNMHTDWVEKGYPISKGPYPVAAPYTPK